MKELVVLQTHVDFYVDSETFDVPKPIVVMYGNTMDGAPIRVEVLDFMAYLYAQPVDGEPVEPEVLSAVLAGSFTKGHCMGVEKVMRKSIYGYAESDSAFYKATFNSPLCLRAAKAFLEEGVALGRGRRTRFKVYESTVPFTLRFMNDVGITGMSYVRIKDHSVVRGSAGGATQCAYRAAGTKVIRTFAEMLEPLPLEGEYMGMLPLKILSFDIETVGSSTSFPVASKDPVIQIGNTVGRFGSSECHKTIFCLKDTADIPGANVHCFETEAELLVAWARFWHDEDPDAIIGYNIKGYDFPYLLERAELLGLQDFCVLGRTTTRCKVISRQQSSSAFGAFDTKDISIDGRLVFDLLHIIRRDHKLRSYSLNAVSYHFLREQKEDVSYLSMYDLQNGTRETRRRIASYCLHDTHLPMRLFDKLNILINYTELARATHVPIEYFSTRGSAVKVFSQICLEANRRGFVIPDINATTGEESFEGAFVMDPARGFYSEPIAVLDFSSLYPSIMISKNLCYTTLLPANSGIDAVLSPSGDRFCTPGVCEGLLPRILQSLLRARKETKRLLRETTDPYLRRAYDGRQNALKVCANSIYGFTGSPTGHLPCYAISQSTTAFGREMIVHTRKLIESHFCTANGYPYDSTVIYGDTDSVMIRMAWRENGAKAEEKQRLCETFDAAKEIAARVTSTFDRPISLEFEKVYYPYLLMNKKRYAGVIYTNTERPDRIDTKGIETVRRDNCELVKDVIQTCLDRILLHKDVSGAIDYVKETVRKLYLEQIDLSQLIISKTYTKEHYATKQTHTELADKLRRRGMQVSIGDRIPYVIVKGDKKSLAYEKSEDPVYVLENSLPIDKEYYIEQQLTKPVHRLFEPIMDNVSALFHGEHTTVIAQSTAMHGPMNSFVKTLEECIGCRRAGSILCTHCRKDFYTHYAALLQRYNEKTATYNKCWVECQRCQGSVVNEVLCINRICPIWYKRTKLIKELSPLQEKLAKVRGLSW
ncbi:DNA polymerase delta subunit 1 [Pancytospora philotis]|nr:DNA polymerase delta subunit 1 [Pancytospora philotis]